MTQNSPVPEWFGKAEAVQRDQRVATKRGLGCGVGVLLVLVAVGALYWAVTAQLRVNHLEARLRSQQAEETQRRVEQDRARLEETRARAALPVPLPPEPPAVAAPATAETAAPTPDPGAPGPEPDMAPPAEQRSAADIHKELSRLRPAFKRCYNVALKDEPTAAGRVTLKLVIGPRGTVTSASASTTGNLPASVATCVAQVARTASFVRASDSTNVSYPLVFQPGQ